MKDIIHLFFFAIPLALVSSLLIYSPAGSRMEESFGLTLLFKIRGSRQPPDEAVIINIDSSTQVQLDLPENFSKWPRSVHADLIRKLNEYGARAIAFDVHFKEARNHDDDHYFAETVRQAGNVILIEQLRRDSYSRESGQNGSEIFEIDILEPPFSPLAESALALAPFPLPKIPVMVNQAWIFKPSAGDVPTLPAVALQVALLNQYPFLHRLLLARAPEAAAKLPRDVEQILESTGVVETMLLLRNAFQQTTYAGETGVILTDGSSGMLENLITLYSGSNTMYINLYGPPSTIPTLYYHDILHSGALASDSLKAILHGKTIFVGAARENWSGQKDGFYTAFTASSGLDLSGVELAATIFCNLYENSRLGRLSVMATTLLMIFCSILILLLCFILSPALLTIALVLFFALYLGLAIILFSSHYLWVPIITPAVILPSAAFLLTLLYKYGLAHKEKSRVTRALGLYLPENVVTELTKDLSYIKTGDKVIYSTCLMTDAENYTTLSERLSPEELSGLMKEYYHCLFSVVKQWHGVVCNMIGDSMLALWPSTSADPTQKKHGCDAALHILMAVERFNSDHPEHKLPTRIGLHSGYLLMGNIGAAGHYEYAPVGDVVNTNSRIESLNKRLGTHILASEETVLDLTGLLTRDLGSFLLGGKTKAIRLHELIDPEQMTSGDHQVYVRLFPEGLSLFLAGRFSEAERLFQNCLTMRAGDGPSLFYLDQCSIFQQIPPDPGWRGAIQVPK